MLLLWGTLGSVQAEPYGHLDDVATQPHTFLAYRLLTADSLRYCAALFPPENPLVTQHAADTLIKAALREWTHGLALQIHQSGREKEFKDIVALLDKPLTLLSVPGCEALSQTQKSVSPQDTQADIVVLVSAKKCEENFKKTTSFYAPATEEHGPFICLRETEPQNPLRPVGPGEYIPQDNTPHGKEILHARQELFETVAAGNYSAATQQALWETNRFFSYDGPTLFATLLHELGHAFGLGDEYLTPRPEAYASQDPGTGIMQNLYSPLTCDEIDGMVTLLDRLNNTHRTFRSFCPDRGLIVDGTEQPS